LLAGIYKHSVPSFEVYSVKASAFGFGFTTSEILFSITGSIKIMEAAGSFANPVLIETVIAKREKRIFSRVIIINFRSKKA
jgi:hypothetical protein